MYLAYAKVHFDSTIDTRVYFEQLNLMVASKLHSWSRTYNMTRKYSQTEEQEKIWENKLMKTNLQELSAVYSVLIKMLL